MKRDLANQARAPADQDEAYQARQQSHKDYGTDGGDPQASEPERAAASVFQAPPSDGEKNYYVSDIASDQNIPSNIRSPAPGQVTQGKAKMMPQSSLKSPGSQAPPIATSPYADQPISQQMLQQVVSQKEQAAPAIEVEASQQQPAVQARHRSPPMS